MKPITPSYPCCRRKLLGGVPGTKAKRIVGSQGRVGYSATRESHFNKKMKLPSLARLVVVAPLLCMLLDGSTADRMYPFSGRRNASQYRERSLWTRLGTAEHVGSRYRGHASNSQIHWFAMSIHEAAVVYRTSCVLSMRRYASSSTLTSVRWNSWKNLHARYLTPPTSAIDTF